MTEWVTRAVVLAIHDEQIAEHGGTRGIPDIGLLDSALHRPQNLEAYGSPDLADLAAAYGFGIARNHAFVDGNKRTSAVVTQVFLALNGADLTATEEARLEIWTSLGAGNIAERELAAWLRHHIVKRHPEGDW